MSKKELLKLLTELLGALHPMVLKQIDKFVKDGHTYKEIARSVYYIYDVLGRDTKDISTYGIGLVPYYIEQANSHFDAIAKQQAAQKQQAQESSIESREVSTQSRVKKKRSEIDISEL